MKRFLFLLGFLYSFASITAQTKDEQAIIDVLEKESATWRSGANEAHASCWAVKPYSRILISTADGQTIDLPSQMMINPPEGATGGGGTSQNSNYKISVMGSSAWVNHDEVSTDPSGKKSYSYEFRMLEKIDGHWKLVGQSIHVYKVEE